MIGIGRFLGCVLFILGAAACAQQPQRSKLTVTIGDQVYSSWDDALVGEGRINEARLAATRQVDDPLHGKALIVFADADRLRPTYDRVTGPLTQFVPKMIELNMANNGALGQVIQRSGLFDQTEIVVRNDTQDPPFEGYDYVLFERVTQTFATNQTGTWQAIWLLKRAPRPNVMAVKADVGVPSIERYNSFVRSIRMAAEQLGAMASSSAHRGAGQPASTLTGIVLSTSGDVLTSDHGIEGCGTITVGKKEDSTAATVLMRDRQNDLALVHAERTFPAAAALRDPSVLERGETVATFGYPLDQLLASTGAFTTGTVTATSGIGDDTRFLQISAAVQPGNSGGPLLDQSGNIAGIVTAKLNALKLAQFTGDIAQNVNFALKASVIRQFLDSADRHYALSQSNKPLSDRALAQRAEEISVRVQCSK